MPHSKQTTHKRRVPFLLILLVAVLCTTVFAAAYLYLSSNTVENSFTAETNPGTSVSGYAVNVGDPGYAVYVRAAVVVNWKSSSATNTVLAEMPKEGTDGDYTLTMNTTDWFEHGGFWYCKAPVTAATPALVSEFTQINTKVGYDLKLELVSQTIQALGTTDEDANGNSIPAVTDAWGITVDTDGNLIDPST